MTYQTIKNLISAHNTVMDEARCVFLGFVGISPADIRLENITISDNINVALDITFKDITTDYDYLMRVDFGNDKLAIYDFGTIKNPIEYLICECEYEMFYKSCWYELFDFLLDEFDD